MKTIVIYDSNFGNTKIIAETIAKSLGKNTKLLLVNKVNIVDLTKFDLIVVGSPINAWRPTENTKKFLNSLKSNQLEGKLAAAFDTRIKVWLSGNAAMFIANSLQNAGAKLIVDPKGFYVTGKEGPLTDGELEKAKKWGRELKKVFQVKIK